MYRTLYYTLIHITVLKTEVAEMQRREKKELSIASALFYTSDDVSTETEANVIPSIYLDILEYTPVLLRDHHWSDTGQKIFYHCGYVAAKTSS